jgi:hypothetical protein
MAKEWKGIVKTLVKGRTDKPRSSGLTLWAEREPGKNPSRAGADPGVDALGFERGNSEESVSGEEILGPAEGALNTGLSAAAEDILIGVQNRREKLGLERLDVVSGFEVLQDTPFNTPGVTGGQS